jgi:hypothetical protein
LIAYSLVGDPAVLWGAFISLDQDFAKAANTVGGIKILAP